MPRTKKTPTKETPQELSQEIVDECSTPRLVHSESEKNDQGHTSSEDSPRDSKKTEYVAITFPPTSHQTLIKEYTKDFEEVRQTTKKVKTEAEFNEEIDAQNRIIEKLKLRNRALREELETAREQLASSPSATGPAVGSFTVTTINFLNFIKTKLDKLEKTFPHVFDETVHGRANAERRITTSYESADKKKKKSQKD